MDEQEESSSACVILRPELQDNHRIERWKKQTRADVIGCCGFPTGKPPDVVSPSGVESNSNMEELGDAQGRPPDGISQRADDIYERADQISEPNGEEKKNRASNVGMQTAACSRIDNGTIAQI